MKLTKGFCAYFGYGEPVFFRTRTRLGDYVNEALKKADHVLDNQGKQAMRNFIEGVTNSTHIRTYPTKSNIRSFGPIAIYEGQIDGEVT